ncbi:hypothetical protein ABZ816_30830 [Actinosynnema sp. NPDC047251]|uniref:Extracellular repeat protein, HAF family n=1 Tax=Saccharothrix espanaensis (strain ATCC 51144 / DSM 44229 / JCM 9112 / NBRC 15066 / NRRL 15764) TaxID=1179773 RepID=K0K5C1_SACES|nr:hypothetical protein [Saccharothrix espanaensis]CCH32787.1 hypothetical protein BN6_55280 [Saccharothrix espanaensis DSM 44229]
MRRLLNVTAAVLLVLTTVPAVASASVKAVDLGVLPGGEYSFANGIGNAGTVVGYANTDDDLVHAVSWTPDNRITDLGTLPGDVGSSATGVNDRGVVYGNSYAESGRGRAVRWVDRVIQELPPLPGHVETLASAINEAGTVVGVSVGADYTDEHAVAWDRSGRVVRLAELPGDQVSQAIGINDAGLIVGYSGRYGTIADLHAVVWTPDGSVTPLVFDGSNAGAAEGIEDTGVVAATIVDRDNRLHAVRFDSDGRGTDLGAGLRATGIGEDGTVLGTRSDRGALHGARWRPGTVEPEFLTVGYAVAAVSRTGVTVGTTRGAGTTSRAMAWTPDGDSGTRLPSLGGPSSSASAVNDHNVAVGSAEITRGVRHAVKWHL